MQVGAPKTASRGSAVHRLLDRGRYQSQINVNQRETTTDSSAATTSTPAPARRRLGAKLFPTAGPQHTLIVAIAVHHPHSIERLRPFLRLGDALVRDLVG